MTVAGGIMKRTFVVFVLLATATAFTQDNKNPVTSVVKEILPRQQKNLIAAAEEMPADKFGFSPTPEQMTFRQPCPAHHPIEQLPLRQDRRTPRCKIAEPERNGREGKARSRAQSEF